MAITVLLVDNSPSFLNSLHIYLATESDLQIVDEASNGMTGLKLASRLHPDVVVMDWVMPGMGGNEATRQIISERPDARVIILSMHADHIHVQNAVQAGACGYILKEDTVEHLAKAIRAAAAGQTYFSPLIEHKIKEILP